MPELRHLTLGEIDEPPLPMRATMDDAKLDSLAASMRDIGQLVPISVVQNGERYTIHFGHRRYVAAARAGLSKLMALVYQPGQVNELAAMIAENVDREDVNDAEQAIFYAQLMDRGYDTEEKLCAATRKSGDYIGDRLRLLRIGGEVFDALRRDEINFSVARELNKCDDVPMREYFLRQAIVAGTGARVVKQWICDWRNRGAQSVAPGTVAAPAEEAPSPEATKIECFLCGGHKDPWNLESVFVHKYEKENILRAIQQSAQTE